MLLVPTGLGMYITGNFDACGLPESIPPVVNRPHFSLNCIKDRVYSHCST